MSDKPKTISLNGKTFEIPGYELFCVKCGTTNYFYSDNKPPYKCDSCGAILVIEKNKVKE
jgi:ribosomal protein S27E